MQFRSRETCPRWGNVVQIFLFSSFSYVKSTKCKTAIQCHVTWKYDYASGFVHPIHVKACSCVTTPRLPAAVERKRESEERRTIFHPLGPALRSLSLPYAATFTSHSSPSPVPHRAPCRSSCFHAKSQLPLIQPRPTGHSSRTAHYRYYELA